MAMDLAQVATALRTDGYCVVENVLPGPLLAEMRPAMYRVRERIVAEVGPERLRRAGEVGVLRLMMKFEPVFFRLLQLPEVLAVVDQQLGPPPSCTCRTVSSCRRPRCARARRSRAASTRISRAC